MASVKVYVAFRESFGDYHEYLGVFGDDDEAIQACEKEEGMMDGRTISWTCFRDGTWSGDSGGVGYFINVEEVEIGED